MKEFIVLDVISDSQGDGPYRRAFRRCYVSEVLEIEKGAKVFFKNDFDASCSNSFDDLMYNLDERK